ncbi:MAG: dihydropteroate synthase, partial [Cyanobacteria bacterium J06642_11]
MTDYDNLLGDITAFLKQQIDQALAVGVPLQNICIDPGIGFAK